MARNDRLFPPSGPPIRFVRPAGGIGSVPFRGPCIRARNRVQNLPSGPTPGSAARLHRHGGPRVFLDRTRRPYSAGGSPLCPQCRPASGARLARLGTVGSTVRTDVAAQVSDRKPGLAGTAGRVRLVRRPDARRSPGRPCAFAGRRPAIRTTAPVVLSHPSRHNVPGFLRAQARDGSPLPASAARCASFISRAHSHS